MAASAPITVLLFVLLPRSVSPFWAGLGGRPRQGVVRHLRSPAARRNRSRRAQRRRGLPRRDRGRRPAPAHPLLARRRPRGDGRAALGHLRAKPPGDDHSRRAAGQRITYFVEPHGSRQLFLLETPSGATIGARTQTIGAARVLQLPLPLARRIRYVGTSVPADRFTERLLPEDRALNLRLPATLPDSIRALAGSIAGGERDPAAVAARLLAHFSRGYTYSLQVPDTAGDPLESFLLGHRTGYCEYFAAALAVMLRDAGHPGPGGQRLPRRRLRARRRRTTSSRRPPPTPGSRPTSANAWVRLDPTPVVRRAREHLCGAAGRAAAALAGHPAHALEQLGGAVRRGIPARAGPLRRGAGAPSASRPSRRRPRPPPSRSGSPR